MVSGMYKCVLFLLFVPVQLLAQMPSKKEVARWQQQAKNVTIIRDTWGIPHIYGKRDADAVFGLLYAQCEDDFARVELNYIEKLGRMAEVRGESELYNDLLIRLVLDSAEAVADYKRSPAWLQALLNAYAGGINYYLYKNPNVKPALLTRFQPWYPLLWTDGSIGAISVGDVSEEELKACYTGDVRISSIPKKRAEEAPTGSNGFAFAPPVTASGNAILYINPHVTFYFRPEVHMVSEEGLNAYGAVTWGQFFVYQGFNEHCGWMHTSSAVDVSDLYEENVSKQGSGFVYEYEGLKKLATKKNIRLRYKAGTALSSKTITTFATHHGPVMAKRDGKWISVKAVNRSIDGLIQSWQRTKTKSFATYKHVMNRRANASNNTVYADAEGNIAYWHGNFIPVRDTAYNWSKPVDGTTKATEWKGLHLVDESVHLYNPPNGWIQNCNSTPFTAAGEASPKREDYPTYMAPDGENFRGINAVRVLRDQKGFTLDKVIAAGYDTYLSAFEVLVPALLHAFARSDSAYNHLEAPMGILKSWDFRSDTASIATTLAVEWATRLLPQIQQYEWEGDQVARTKAFAAHATPQQLLQPFAETISDLQKNWNTWQVPWGRINRFQRTSGSVVQTYNDSLPSLPVPFAASTWGMLPSYVSRYYPGTKKRYGVNGNSFICAVEFGKTVKAKSLLAGGQNSNPASPHFFDQGKMYTQGRFKDVLFYKDDVLKHAGRTYHPGE
jgi:acyl-homoserine-lactone acylase